MTYHKARQVAEEKDSITIWKQCISSLHETLFPVMRKSFTLGTRKKEIFSHQDQLNEIHTIPTTGMDLKAQEATYF